MKVIEMRIDLNNTLDSDVGVDLDGPETVIFFGRDDKSEQGEPIPVRERR